MNAGFPEEHLSPQSFNFTGPDRNLDVVTVLVYVVLVFLVTSHLMSCTPSLCSRVVLWYMEAIWPDATLTAPVIHMDDSRT